MFVVQLFLPLEKPDGSPMPASLLDRIKGELTDRFGGVTAFLQSPAEGAWKPPGDEVIHDRIAIFEVMAEDVDTSWWRQYRTDLEQELHQEKVLVRLFPITIL